MQVADLSSTYMIMIITVFNDVDCLLLILRVYSILLACKLVGLLTICNVVFMLELIHTHIFIFRC